MPRSSRPPDPCAVQIVALANLYPPKDTPLDDLDSHMFQTVGHQLVESIAECMELPLYRSELRGGSNIRDLNYAQPASTASAEAKNQDEIEDLFGLLQAVKTKHPDVQAVSCGAILSNYQRLRVENVCGRVGLTPLCYMWNRNQSELLHEMILAGIEAIFVKVAVVGLDASHLGKTIAQLYPLLTSLGQKYGVGVCGEGGEYETMVLDCPLYKRKRIVIDKAERVGNVTGPAAIAPVCMYKPVAFRVVDKTPEEMERATVAEIPMPKPVTAADVEQHTAAVAAPQRQPQWSTTSGATQLAASHEFKFVAQKRDSEGTEQAATPLLRLVAQATICVDAASGSKPDAERDSSLTREALRALFRAYARRVQNLTGMCMNEEALSMLENEAAESLVYVNLVIPFMESFIHVNKAYQDLVPLRAAPARACVASTRMSVAGVSESVVLSSGAVDGKQDSSSIATVSVTVEGIFVPPKSKFSTSRLHVQAISAWAPASIGPYAQAYETAGLVLPAGQIGLVPPRLALPSTYPALEARQAFMNVRATLNARVSRMRRDVLHSTIYVDDKFFPADLLSQSGLTNFHVIYASLAEGYYELRERALIVKCLLSRALSDDERAKVHSHSLSLFVSLVRHLILHPRRKPLCLLSAEERQADSLRYSKWLKTRSGCSADDSDDVDSWGYDSLVAQAAEEECGNDQESPENQYAEQSTSELLATLAKAKHQESLFYIRRAASKVSAADLIDIKGEDETGLEFSATGQLSLLGGTLKHRNLEDDSGSEDEDDAAFSGDLDKLSEPTTIMSTRTLGKQTSTETKHLELSQIARATALQELSRFAPLTYLAVPMLPRQAWVEIQVLSAVTMLRLPLAMRKVVGAFQLSGALEGDVLVCDALLRGGAAFYTVTYLTKDRATESSEVSTQALSESLFTLASKLESLVLSSNKVGTAELSNEVVNRLIVSHPSLHANETQLRASLLSASSFGSKTSRIDPHGIVIAGSFSTNLIQVAEAERVLNTVYLLQPEAGQEVKSPSGLAPALLLSEPPAGMTLVPSSLLDPLSEASIGLHNGWRCGAVLSRAVIQTEVWARLENQATGCSE